MTTPHPAELTEAERVRLRELADAATPGPWDARMADVWSPHHKVAQTASEPGPTRLARADAEFIAAARTAVPALLDALEAAEQNAAVWAKSTGRIAAEKHMAQIENRRLREGIEAVLLHTHEREWPAEQLRALLSTSSVRGEGDE